MKWLCGDGLNAMDGRDGKVRISENGNEEEMRVFRDDMKVSSRFEWYWVKWEWLFESIFELNINGMGEFGRRKGEVERMKWDDVEEVILEWWILRVLRRGSVRSMCCCMA